MSVKTVIAIRKANLRLLLQQWEGPSTLAKKLGYAGPSYLSQIVGGHRPITEKTARDIEAKLDLPAGWMDRDKSGESGRVDNAQVADAVIKLRKSR